MEVPMLEGNVATVSVFLSTAVLAWIAVHWAKTYGSKNWIAGVPLIGYLPFLGPDPHLTILDLANKYGELMWMKVGLNEFCVLNTLDKIKELTKVHAHATATKPATTTAKATKGGAHFDHVPGRWKKRKGFIMRALRMAEKQHDFPISEIAKEEMYIMINSLEKKAKRARQITGRPQVQAFEDFAYFAVRNMYRVNLGTSSQFDPDIDELLKELASNIIIYSITAGPLSWYDVLPFWKYIKREQFNKFCRLHDVVEKICKTGLERFLANDVASLGCIAGHFQMLAAGMTEEQRADIDLNDEVLLNGVLDVFRAGSESTTAMLYWFTLYMAAFPEIQIKARKEVEEYCNASFSNLGDLQYFQALQHEILRHSSLAPFGKRLAAVDITLSDGTFCPKGTAFLLNFYAVNRDPTMWKNPDAFDPGHFLKPDGSFDTSKVEYMLPFGAGMRRCPGEASGKATVSMVSAALLTHFDIECPPGTKPDIKPVFGISLAPKVYEVVLSTRQ